MKDTIEKASPALAHRTTQSKPAGIWVRLLEPAASIIEPERRRRARLLAALLGTQFLLANLIIVLTLSTTHASSDIYSEIASEVILAIAYFLSRTQYYDLGALLGICSLSGSVFASMAVNPNSATGYFLVLGVLMGSLFLSRRATALIIAVTIIGIVLVLGATFPAFSVRDAIGAIAAVVCVGVLGSVGIIIRQQDLQEIQRQSISLRQSEERFHLISYATNDVVWDWDLLTGQVWRNQGIQRLFGFRDDEIRPEFSWWEERIHPDEREKTVRNIQAAITDGETFWSKEYRVQRADNSYIYVFDRAYIIRDEGGKPLRMLGAIMEITKQKQAEEVLRQESLHDPLTGLYNRRYMEEMLEREIRRAERNQQQISIIMLDVDNFKQVNDKFGHAAGDTLLHNLGLFLLKYVRGADIACRYGGDEFLLILPGASLEVTHQRAEKIRAEADNLGIVSREEINGRISLSLGVAMFPDQGSTLKAILAAADVALYDAKEAGRNRVAVAGAKIEKPKRGKTGKDEFRK